MAEIDEIEKLRPELLKLSVTELERRKVEIDMAIVRKAEMEAEEQREKDYEEAVGLTQDLVRIVIRLNDLDRLSPRVKQALSRDNGEFVPGVYIKKPRS